MMTCKEVSRLVSESLEQKLALRQRIAMWFHLGMCRFCFGFRRNLLRIRLAVGDCAERIEADSADSHDTTLPAESRVRMKRVLRDEAS